MVYEPKKYGVVNKTEGRTRLKSRGGSLAVGSHLPVDTSRYHVLLASASAHGAWC